MTIYTVVNFLTRIMEAIIVFTLMNSFLEPKKEMTKLLYGGGIIALACLISISNHIYNISLLNVVGMILAILLVSVIFKGGIKTKIIIAVLSVLLLAVFEIIVLYLITLLGRISVDEAVHNQQLRLLGIILSKLLALGVANIFYIKKGNKIHSVKTSYWLLFLMIFSTSILAVYLIFKLQYDSGIVNMSYLSVICSFGLLFNTFFTLYLYENMEKQVEVMNQQKMYEQQVKSQAKHLDEILIAQKQLKVFQHDLKNHMIAVHSYFANHNYEEGLTYLETIKLQLALDNTMLQTGNTALDAIINTKKAVAESKKITFHTNIQIPEQLPIEATDVCIVWGNLLDNAIEACEKLPEADREITLSLIWENNSIICKIANPNPNEYNPRLNTTKKDKKQHGMGLENVQKTLAKYHAVFRVNQTEEQFVISFIIFTND